MRRPPCPCLRAPGPGSLTHPSTLLPASALTPPLRAQPGPHVLFPVFNIFLVKTQNIKLEGEWKTSSVHFIYTRSVISKPLGREKENTGKGMLQLTDPDGHPRAASSGSGRRSWLVLAAAAAWQHPESVGSCGLLAQAGCLEGGDRRPVGKAVSAIEGGRGRQGLPSGVRVDGRDVTQAVVKGPIGEEAAVLGAAGCHVFRWLWWQGLIACGYSGEQGLGWRMQGLCLIVFSEPLHPILLPRVPLIVSSTGPALRLYSPRKGSQWVGGGALGLALPKGPGQLDRQMAGLGQSVTQCWAIGQNAGKRGRAITVLALGGLSPPGRGNPAHPYPFRFLHPTRHEKPKEGDEHLLGSYSGLLKS